MYSEWSDLSLIEDKTADLSDKTIPLLVKVAQLSDLQNGLEASLASLQVTTQPVEVDKVASRVNTLVSIFQENFVGDGADTVGLSPSDADVFKSVSSGQRALVLQNARTDRLVLDVLELLITLKQSILIAQNEVGSRPHRIIGQPQGYEPYYADLDTAKTLGEMSGSVASLAILTRGFLDNQSRESTTALRLRIVSQINILATRLARLSDLGAREDIARLLLEYRSKMVDQAGVFDEVFKLEALQLDQIDRQAKAHAFLDEVAAWSKFSTQQAATDFTQSAVETNEIVQRIRLIDMMFNLGLLLLSLALLWFMIERRIISRLSRLTGYVQKLSRGYLDKRIETTGRDEIAEVEKAVEQSRLTSQALQRSNEELERFAYVAAHDLRAPLRAISNLVEWTQEDFADRMTPDAQQNISLIRSRVERLSGHLTALLDYARAGQIEGERGQFDLAEITEELRKHFHTDANFVLEIGQDDGRFETYLTPLKTILINLVSNAAKHHDKENGVIALESRIYHSHVEISVSDDGPGIPKQYQQQIFVLFQTLKSRDDIEGSGLGLALVQKLAHSLGGHVTVASDPDIARGTVFKVHIPLLSSGNITHLSYEGKAA